MYSSLLLLSCSSWVDVVGSIYLCTAGGCSLCPHWPACVVRQNLAKWFGLPHLFASLTSGWAWIFSTGPCQSLLTTLCWLYLLWPWLSLSPRVLPFGKQIWRLLKNWLVIEQQTLPFLLLVPYCFLGLKLLPICRVSCHLLRVYSVLLRCLSKLKCFIIDVPFGHKTLVQLLFYNRLPSHQVSKISCVSWPAW